MAISVIVKKVHTSYKQGYYDDRTLHDDILTLCEQYAAAQVAELSDDK
jgi:hypothetical protein